jgi:hypothetical protein
MLKVSNKYPLKKVPVNGNLSSGLFILKILSNYSTFKKNETTEFSCSDEITTVPTLNTNT